MCALGGVGLPGSELSCNVVLVMVMCPKGRGLPTSNCTEPGKMMPLSYFDLQDVAEM